MARITVVGSLNMDLVITTPKMPVMGETILGNGFMTAPGGKGSNQAVAAAKLGAEVMMVGCTGQDLFARELEASLTSSGVHTGHVRKLEGFSTGVAMVVLKDGDNFIIVDSGANAQVSPEDVENAEAYIAKSDMVLLQMEIPLPTIRSAIRTAAKHKVPVILNPAPAAKLQDADYAGVEVITPNETECEILTGITVKNRDDAARAAAYFRERGVSHVVITMGGQGVMYSRGDQMIHMPARKVEVVDTTAAGDSFTAALAVRLCEGDDMDAAIEYATVVGALTVSRKGAQTSLPSHSEVEAYRQAASTK